MDEQVCKIMNPTDDMVIASGETEITTVDINQNKTSHHSSPLLALSLADFELDEIVVIYSSNEKIADPDPVAVELNLVQNELMVFGRTKKNRLELVKQMQEKLFGNELTTEHGLTIGIPWSTNPTGFLETELHWNPTRKIPSVVANFMSDLFSYVL
ncbi:unnamed protein product [Adineta ricciae]|uniref:Uncharacterized protein n=1 Tax=Adineta ricciae TaxID=249248 RepID=A0A815QU72_ADIRI|nr:unnamed protein product [Adineta ricciae]CAF1565549.1 unnamed protein product [Adineta ricciae]